MGNKNKKLTVLELCAGGGGQFLGLEQAGFECVGAVEIESDYCNTLVYNRPALNVINSDVKNFDAKRFAGVDLVAGGVPCPPFSIAGKQLGENDERDLFPYTLKIVKQVRPKAVLIENVFQGPVGDSKTITVGKALKDLMSENGWAVAGKWAQAANAVAPTLVGGSKKHGGPDLGPTRSREQWRKLGVDGSG